MNEISVSNPSIPTGEVEQGVSGSSGEVEQGSGGKAGMAGEVEQTKVVRIYGDRIGRSDWTEVELSKATYLGKEVLVIPDVGSMVGVIVENQWLVIVIPGVLVLIAFLLWGKMGKKKDAANEAKG